MPPWGCLCFLARSKYPQWMMPDMSSAGAFCRASPLPRTANHGDAHPEPREDRHFPVKTHLHQKSMHCLPESRMELGFLYIYWRNRATLDRPLRPDFSGRNGKGTDISNSFSDHTHPRKAASLGGLKPDPPAKWQDDFVLGKKGTNRKSVSG